MGSDTYPPTGDHSYQVTVYDNSNKVIGQDTKTATVPSGSYVPPPNAPSGEIATPDVNQIDFPFPWDNHNLTAAGLVTQVIGWLFGGIAALGVIAIVYSGVMMITAGADTTKAENAKKNLTWAIIGLVLAVSAYFLITLIINRLNSI